MREDPAAAAPAGRLRAWLGRLPRWWPLPLCAALGAAGGASYGLLEPPRYAATSYVVVVPGKGTDPAGALGFAQAYGRVATGGAVIADAHRVSRVPLGALRGGVRVMTSPDAPMIEITGTAGTPRTSATVANAVARSLARTGNATADRTGAELMVLSLASVPSEPVSPSVPVATGVGACAGGLLGGLLLLVRPAERRNAKGHRGGGPPGRSPGGTLAGAAVGDGRAARTAEVPAPAQGSAGPPREAAAATTEAAPEAATGTVR
ncbi:hypothetical protein AB0I10_04980 [Streptomyces sp. NPDC050636]|uniref:hypothetical protein n=1 Tax=Streptomyces sp. NPDC050636 TaxID=3154510 RepID=UPI003419C941